jgi:anti-sigma factor RsiW
MSNERFAELLPWYVNGSIEAADRAWVDSYLSEHPDARAELAWYRSLQKRIQETVPAVPATIGLSKAMNLIRGDRPTVAERISAFFGAFAMRPAVTFALLGVIVVQGGVMTNLISKASDDEVAMRAMRAQTVEEGPLVKVNFAPDAKESDIRLLLVSVQGTLTGGPGQLGDYYVRVPAGKEEQAVAKLKGKPIVQAVELAPGIPPRD